MHSTIVTCKQIIVGHATYNQDISKSQLYILFVRHNYRHYLCVASCGHLTVKELISILSAISGLSPETERHAWISLISSKLLMQLYYKSGSTCLILTFLISHMKQHFLQGTQEKIVYKLRRHLYEADRPSELVSQQTKRQLQWCIRCRMQFVHWQQ